MNRTLIWLATIYSGFYIMSLEILAGRMLAPSFGADLFVWGSVIAVFMLGLACGYGAGGMLSASNPPPERLGLILIAGGFLGILIVLSAPTITTWIAMTVQDVRLGAFAAAFVLFFPPSLAAGVVNPLGLRLIVTSVEKAGLAAGTLSFASTIGSAVGVILTSFVLILFFEVQTILSAMAIFAILIGLLLFVQSKFQPSSLAEKDTP